MCHVMSSCKQWDVCSKALLTSRSYRVKRWATVGTLAFDAQQPMPTHACISMVSQSTYATNAMMCHVIESSGSNTGPRNNSGTL